MFTEYPRITADQHMIELITDCLRLIGGGNLDPHGLESLLEYELETHHKEAVATIGEKVGCSTSPIRAIRSIVASASSS